MALRCPYQTLQVPFDADDAAIAKAYKKAAIKWHPDKAGSDGAKAMEAKEQMQRVNFANEILKQQEYRSFYDKTRMSSSTEEALMEVTRKMHDDMSQRMRHDEDGERQKEREADPLLAFIQDMLAWYWKLEQQRAAEARRAEVEEKVRRAQEKQRREAEKKERQEKAEQEKAEFQKQSKKSKKEKAEKKQHHEAQRELAEANQKARKQVEKRLQQTEERRLASQEQHTVLTKKYTALDVQVTRRLPHKINENKAKKNRKGPDFSNLEKLEKELKAKTEERDGLKEVIAALKLQSFFLSRLILRLQSVSRGLAI